MFGNPDNRAAAEAWRRRAIIGFAMLAAWLFDWLTGWPFLYAIPVALAAALLGWRATAASVFLSAAGLVALSPAPPLAAAADATALVVLGGALAWATARERNLRTHYQQAAEQLSNVYEKVQANFEGMKRAERLSALGQLSAGLAHEIRNPLASISGAAALLAREPALDDPKSAKCVAIIESESQRLNRLLTNFLNFARPRPPRLETLALEPVLDNVVGLASHGIRGKSVHIEKKTAPRLPLVECDAEQLEQVLLNLMINAIEASPDGQTVALSAAVEGDRIVIGVVDHGHGVAPVHIDRLFDPFFTTKEHGTGLGLPVAHQIVRQMGGSLLAEANAKGGMTFSVVLPAKSQKS